MPTVTYKTYDLLTLREIDDLPLYGVSMNAKLSESGTFTGTCRLDNERKPAAQILESTVPGKTLVVPEIEGTPLEAYIIWSRTYQSTGRTLQFYGETLESYPKQRINSATRTFTNVDKRNVFIALWNAIQQDPRGNINVIMPGTFPNQIPTTFTTNGYEFEGYGKLIDDIVSDDDSFDYRIQVVRNNGALQFNMLIGYPQLGMSAEASNLTFSYPGAITQFWLPENASAGCTTLYGIGRGDGASQLWTRQDNVDQLNAGYPIIEDTYSIKDEGTQARLNTRTRAEANRRRVPISSMSFEIDPTVEPVFGGWALGDYAIFDLEDYRFPEPYRSSQRIIGWTYTPSSSDGVAGLRLAIQGEDEAATDV